MTVVVIMDYKQLVIAAPQLIEILEQTAVKLTQLLVSTIKDISLLDNCSSELKRKLKEYKIFLQETIVYSRAWIRKIHDYVKVQNDSIEVSDWWP